MKYKQITFSKLIKRNEFRAIIGWRYQTLIFLTAILYITFLCFGFSRSALDSVNRISENSFNKWVNIKFTGVKPESFRQLDKQLSDESFKKSYLIRNSNFYSIFGVSFYDKSNKLGNVYGIRTIDPNSPIINDLLNKSNLIYRYGPNAFSNVFKTTPEGFIVTQNLLNELGFNNDTIHYLFLKFDEEILPIPILAIVKELPDLVDVVCSNYFYCNKLKVFDIQESSSLKILVEKIDIITAIKFKKEIAKKLKIDDLANIQINPFEELSDSMMNCIIDIPDEGLNLSRKERYSEVASIPLIQDFHFGEFNDFKVDTNCNDKEFSHDYLAVDFQKLEKIREFSDFIESDFNVSINMETTIQRENYLFVGNLALAAILMVIVLSVFSLSLYISETFKNHILKVKKNLGNLMALGASNNDLIILYLQVALRMLLYAILIALIFGYISGELFEKYFLGKLLVLQKDQDYFSLLNFWLVLFIILIIIIALLMTYFTIKRILKVSPGDLIYERDNQGNFKICSGKRKFYGKGNTDNLND